MDMPSISSMNVLVKFTRIHNTKEAASKSVWSASRIVWAIKMIAKWKEMKLPRVVQRVREMKTGTDSRFDFTSVSISICLVFYRLHYAFGSVKILWTRCIITWHLLCMLRIFIFLFSSVFIYFSCLATLFFQSLQSYSSRCGVDFLFTYTHSSVMYKQNMGCAFYAMARLWFNAIFPQAIQFLTRFALFSRHWNASASHLLATNLCIHKNIIIFRRFSSISQPAHQLERH